MRTVHNEFPEQSTAMLRPSSDISCRSYLTDDDDEQFKCASCTYKNVIVFSFAFIAANAPVVVIFVLYSQLSPVAPIVMRFLSLPIVQYTGQIIIAMSAISAMVLWCFRIGGTTCRMLGWIYVVVYGAMGISLVFTVHSVSASFVLILLSPFSLLMSLKATSVGDNLCWRFAATILLCSSVLSFAVWLLWLLARLPNIDKCTDWTPEFREMVRGEYISWKDAFVSWALPAAISVELSFISVLCWTRTSQLDKETNTDNFPPHVTQIILQVKQMVLAIFSLAVILWIGASVDGTGAGEFGQKREDFGDEVMRIAFFAVLGICGWAAFVLRPDGVRLAVQHSRVVQQFIGFLDNDWVKGLALLTFSPIFAFLFLIPDCSEKMQYLHEVVMLVRSWNWTSILIKGQWWGAVYMCFNVGFAKATVVLLAWTNAVLANWPVSAVSSIIFLLGYFLFLLPPTPGVPVYMVTGIVIVSSALRQGWEFWTATLLAIFVGFSIKMAFAATAQKCIGEPLANFVAIRRAVGVTTVEMRAIELILHESSLTLPKVAVLIGGPDWPVAVLCGLLKLPLFPILLGICPILFQSVIPCVLSGALLVSKDNEIKALGDTALAVAGALQGVAAIVAGYYIQEAIEEHYHVLCESRPQDEEVEKFAMAAAQVEKAYNDATVWQVLPFGIQLLLIMGLILAEASIAVLSGPWKSMFGISCFKPFSLMSSIDTDLDGNVWSIVLPAGWIGLGIYGLSCSCLASFYLWASRFKDFDTDEMSSQNECGGFYK